MLKISVKVEMPFQIPGRTASFLLDLVCFRLFVFTCVHRKVFVQFTVVLEGEKFSGVLQKKKMYERKSSERGAAVM